MGILSGISLLTTSCYVAEQGYHLVKDLVSAEPIEKLRADGKISPREREFFDRVEDVRRFGVEYIGLVAGDSYRRYVSYDRDYLVAVVSAVDELSFTRKEWNYPVVGRAPYRGFYRPERAERLAAALRAEGWDVVVRPVDAFSTLGYFGDLLYSFMVDNDEARLAEVIIHEMAHATLWVKGEGQFNEEFATFVGRKGTLDYLVRRYGADSPEVKDVLQRRHDGDLFRDDVLRLRGRLETLYNSMAADGEEVPVGAALGDAARRDAVRSEKSEVISVFQRDFDRTYNDRYLTDRYRFFVDTHVNNAWIDLYQTYGAGLPVLEEFYRTAGTEDLRLTVASIRSLMEGRKALQRSRRPAPMEVLRTRIRAATGDLDGRAGSTGRAGATGPAESVTHPVPD